MESKTQKPAGRRGLGKTKWDKQLFYYRQNQFIQNSDKVLLKNIAKQNVGPLSAMAGRVAERLEQEEVVTVKTLLKTWTVKALADGYIRGETGLRYWLALLIRSIWRGFPYA